MAPPDRRSGEERRTEEKIARLEERVENHSRTLDTIAPVSVHLAEMNLHYAETKAAWQRMEARLDPLHTRLRHVEYAVIALTLAAFSPKLGGPTLPQAIGALLGLF